MRRLILILGTMVMGALAVAPESALAQSPTDIPQLSVSKVASPTTRDTPGGLFTFTVGVVNNGTAPFTITALTDNLYGDLATRVDPAGFNSCAGVVGTVLAPGVSITCAFTGSFACTTDGQAQTDTVTATATTAGENENAVGESALDVGDVDTSTGTANATVSCTAPDPNDPNEAAEDSANLSAFANLLNVLASHNLLNNANTSTNTNPNNSTGNANSNSTSSVANNPVINITNNPTINIALAQGGAPGAPGPKLTLAQKTNSWAKVRPHGHYARPARRHAGFTG